MSEKDTTTTTIYESCECAEATCHILCEHCSKQHCELEGPLCKQCFATSQKETKLSIELLLDKLEKCRKEQIELTNQLFTLLKNKEK